MVTPAELPINTSASAMQMANAIFGDGVTVVNASYTGANGSSGIYSNGDSIAPGVTPSDSGVILSTGNAGDITNPPSSGGWWWSQPNEANENPDTSTDTSGRNNDPMFNEAAGHQYL